MSSPTPVPPEFEYSNQEEPHKSRRKELEARYPETMNLGGPDITFTFLPTLIVLMQVAMAYFVQDMSWWSLLLVAYLIGGTFNHAMTLALHETSHLLGFSAAAHNNFFGIFVNLPLGIPAYASFQRYHRDHHTYQGVWGIDADVPTVSEGKVFTNTPMKVLWVLLQPAFYALRPLLTSFKAPKKWEVMNLVAQLTFDAAILYFWGAKSLVYLVGGTLLGMGIHPMAGHFIAEHYTFIKGQETYSYYGPLNWLSFNVGYHNEHHDMYWVPGSRLPLLREAAPGMYESLPHHSSWVLVIWQYIMDPKVGPFSRVIRDLPAGMEPLS